MLKNSPESLDRGMEAFCYPSKVVEVIEPLAATRMPPPEVRMNAAAVSVLFDRPHYFRTRLNDPVRSPPAFLNLRIGSNEPVEQYWTTCVLLELFSEGFEMQQGLLRSLPFSRSSPSLSRVRFEINQQQNGTGTHTIRSQAAQPIQG